MFSKRLPLGEPGVPEGTGEDPDEVLGEPGVVGELQEVFDHVEAQRPEAGALCDPEEDLLDLLGVDGFAVVEEGGDRDEERAVLGLEV